MGVEQDRETGQRIVGLLSFLDFPLSAKFLNHYLQDGGETLSVSLEILRESSAFTAAERTLLNRVGRQVLRDTIAMLNAGEISRAVVEVRDEGEHLTTGAAVEYFSPLGDLYGVLGTAHIRTYPDITIQRVGDALSISGEVRLEMHDTYDFDSKGDIWDYARAAPSILLGFAVDRNPLALEDLQAFAAAGAKAFAVETMWWRSIACRSAFEGLMQDVREHIRGQLLGQRGSTDLIINVDDAFVWK